MSWSAYPHHPAPPPLPTGPDDPPQPPQPPSLPFGMHPSRFYDPGYGIDHTDHTTPAFPATGFEAWASHPAFAGPWGRGGGPWGRGRGGGGRHHHYHGGPWGRRWHHRGPSGEDEPSGDEEMRDVNETSKDNEKAAHENERDGEKDDSPGTVREHEDEEHPDPPEEIPSGCRERPGCGGRRGFGRRGGRSPHRGPHHHGPHHHGPHPHGPHPHGHGHHGRHQHGPMPPPPPYAHGLDFNAFGDMMRKYVEQVQARAAAFISPYGDAYRTSRDNNNNDDGQNVEGDNDNFMPPVDIFDTADNWMIHLALPGAKKGDIGVNWDAAKGTLVVSGVVHRPGDEAFIASMVSGERKVGMFERSIKLPPPGTGGEKEEVDGEGITARMEDGILVVTVPKVEKEWTEVRKVDIL